MASKRTTLVAGTILGGILLLGTAGLALAQDPTPSPTSAPSSGSWGSMMGGSGMMGNGSGTGQGMMGNGSGTGQGMMGGHATGMDADDMAAMHQAMTKTGTCDPKLMQSFHDSLNANPSASPRS